MENGNMSELKTMNRENIIQTFFHFPFMGIYIL